VRAIAKGRPEVDQFRHHSMFVVFMAAALPRSWSVPDTPSDHRPPAHPVQHVHGICEATRLNRSGISSHLFALKETARDTRTSLSIPLRRLSMPIDPLIEALVFADLHAVDSDLICPELLPAAAAPPPSVPRSLPVGRCAASGDARALLI